MAKFCTECGSALGDGLRFCTTCGAEVPAPGAAVPAPAPPAVPVPPPAAVAKPRSGATGLGRFKWEIVLGILAGAIAAFLGPRSAPVPTFVTAFAVAFVATLAGHVAVSGVGRIWRPLAPIAALLLLFGGVAAAASYYVAAPDLPGGPADLLPDVGRLVQDLTPVSDAPLSSPLPTLPPAPTPDPVAVATLAREAQTAAVIRAAGLPVTAVHLITLEDGQEALVVGLSYQRLVDALNDPTGLGSGIDALTRVAGVKAIDLGGVAYLTTALIDEQGRPILAVSAEAATVAAFRSGTATRTDLIRGLAFKAESRAALLDAVRRQVSR